MNRRQRPPAGGPPQRREPTFGAPQPREPQRAPPPQRDRAYAAEPDDAHDTDAEPDPMPGDERVPRLREMRQDPHEGREGRSLAGRIAIASLVGVLLLAVTAATFLFILQPSKLIEERIVALIEERTGRKLTLTKPAAFTLWPGLGISLNGVALSAPPGMKAEPLLTARRLDVVVRLMPLLTREVAVEQLVLSQPVVHLVIGADGRRSWDFAQSSGGEPRRVQLAQAAPASGKGRTELPPVLKDFLDNAHDPRAAGGVAAGHGAAPSGGRLGGLDDVALGDVRIVGGTVRYVDLKRGVQHETSGIDARIAMRTLAGPATIAGNLTYKAEPLTLEARIDTPRHLVDGRPSRIVVAVSGVPAAVRYDGTIANRGRVESEGKLSIEAASARRLGRWLGFEVPDAPGYGRLAVAGQLVVRDDTVSLDAAALGLGASTGAGTMSVDLGKARAVVQARLTLAALDIDSFQAKGIGPAGGPGGDGGARFAPAAGPAKERGPGREALRGSVTESNAGAPATSIEELLRRDGATPGGGPQVKGFTQRDGWSSAALDVSALGAVDADARVSIGQVTGGGMKTGRAQLRVGLKDGALRLDIDELALYEGRATGFVTVTAADPPRLAANLQLTDVSALPLLEAASGFDWLAGKARISLALAGSGRSEREIVESLTGRTSLSVKDGQLIGYDIQSRLGGLAHGRIAGLERNASERTPFSELAATFQTTAGVAKTNDLRMTSPIVRMTGAGTISLPPREVDLMLQPKLVAAGAGQQANAAEAAGLEVPVKIKGSWAKPSVTPDIDGVLKNPNQVVETIKQLGRNVDKKALGDALGKILGNTESGAGDGKAVKPSEALRQLFGR